MNIIFRVLKQYADKNYCGTEVRKYGSTEESIGRVADLSRDNESKKSLFLIEIDKNKTRLIKPLFMVYHDNTAFCFRQTFFYGSDLSRFFWIDSFFLLRYSTFTFEKNAALAQSVEHVICNLGVVGSSPTGSFLKKRGVSRVVKGDRL